MASCQQKSHQRELSGNFPAFLGQKTAIFRIYPFDFKQIPTVPTKLTQYLTFKNNELNNIFTIQWEQWELSGNFFKPKIKYLSQNSHIPTKIHVFALYIAQWNFCPLFFKNAKRGN